MRFQAVLRPVQSIPCIFSYSFTGRLRPPPVRRCQCKAGTLSEFQSLIPDIFLISLLMHVCGGVRRNAMKCRKKSFFFRMSGKQDESVRFYSRPPDTTSQVILNRFLIQIIIIQGFLLNFQTGFRLQAQSCGI